jgi:hypothetical protein
MACRTSQALGMQLADALPYEGMFDLRSAGSIDNRLQGRGWDVYWLLSLDSRS